MICSRAAGFSSYDTPPPPGRQTDFFRGGERGSLMPRPPERTAGKAAPTGAQNQRPPSPKQDSASPRPPQADSAMTPTYRRTRESPSPSAGGAQGSTPERRFEQHVLSWNSRPLGKVCPCMAQAKDTGLWPARPALGSSPTQHSPISASSTTCPMDGRSARKSDDVLLAITPSHASSREIAHAWPHSRQRDSIRRRCCPSGLCKQPPRRSRIVVVVRPKPQKWAVQNPPTSGRAVFSPCPRSLLPRHPVLLFSLTLSILGPWPDVKGSVDTFAISN